MRSTPEERERIREMYATGATLREIGIQVGRSPKSVHHLIMRHKLGEVRIPLWHTVEVRATLKHGGADVPGRSHKACVMKRWRLRKKGCAGMRMPPVAPHTTPGEHWQPDEVAHLQAHGVGAHIQRYPARTKRSCYAVLYRLRKAATPAPAPTRADPAEAEAPAPRATSSRRSGSPSRPRWPDQTRPDSAAPLP